MSVKLGKNKSDSIYKKYLELLSTDNFTSGQIEKILCQEFGLKRSTCFDHSVKRYKQEQSIIATEPITSQEDRLKTNKAKILIFDIETFANLGYVWGKWDQNVIAYEREWFALCFCYKWLGEKRVSSVALPDFDLYNEDKFNDYEVVKAMWKLFDEADIVVAHNGDKFDIKKMNARFLYYRLPPPSTFKSIDTVKIARQKFAMNSNKLDDIGKYLGVGRKVVNTGWDLWKRCSEGDLKAWEEMIRYNKQDVVLLEKVYEIFKPYITNHPNLNLYNNTLHCCPNCSSSRVQKRGFSMTRVSKSQRYQCMDCGAWSQSPVSGDKIIR